MPTTTDKAVILARGQGTRMRAEDGTTPLAPRQAAVADTGVKALMPLADRPFLDYVLSTLADAGCRRVCLVVGPEHQAIRDYLRRIIEKPDTDTLSRLRPPLWVSMNCYRFGPTIFSACRSIPRSPRGEFELTAAVQYAIDVLGERFRVVPLHAPVLDLTGRRDIALIEARLAGMEVRL